MRHEARVKLQFTELGISRMDGRKYLAQVSHNKDKRAVIWDSTCPGLCLRLGVNGSKSYFAIYYRKGKARSKTLGKVGDISLKQARQQTYQLRQSKGVSGGNREQAIVAKSLSFIKQGIEPECSLYRAYDPKGDLILAQGLVTLP